MTRGAPSRRRRPRPDAPVVEARDLTRVYEVRRGLLREPARLQAVGGVSFTIEAGRTLAVVGESGCGKSTLARVVALIEPPTAGDAAARGVDAVTRRRRRAARAAQDGADGVPEPLRLAQPAQEDRRDPRGAARDQHRRSAPAERGRARAGDAGQGRPAARALRALSAHVLRRPAPAHRDRARADARARRWSSPTSRSRRSTCRCRRRC